jgi:hypothetical protein
MIDAMLRGGRSGSDNGEEGQGLATVTPIRPDIQPGDTTTFGSPVPHLPSQPPTGTPPDNEDTWSASPTRRMRADDPDETSAFAAADTTAFGPTPAQDQPIDDHVAKSANARPVPGDDTYVRQDLEPMRASTEQSARRAVRSAVGGASWSFR